MAVLWSLVPITPYNMRLLAQPYAEFTSHAVVRRPWRVVNDVLASTLTRSRRCAFQVFFQGPDEMNAEAAEALALLDASIVDTQWFPELANLYLRGWQMKAAALMHSSFEEFIMLDADNVPATDPTHLFDSEDYLRHGNLYWRDFATDPHWIKPEFMATLGITMTAGEPELEAGQMVLNKRRVWPSLVLYEYMNREFMYFYRRMYGDKDTHRLAYKISGQTLTVAPHHPESIGQIWTTAAGPRFCGDSMVHLSPNGRPAFLHRTLSDFKVGCPPSMCPLLVPGWLGCELVRGTAVARTTQTQILIHRVANPFATRWFAFLLK